MNERPKAITIKGNPFTLVGPELKAGQTAPDFTVLAQDFSPIKLSDFKGKTVVVAAVPSLDTPVCDAETRRFNEEAAKFPEVKVLVVSMDLPFAQKRFCTTAGIANVVTGSDFKDRSFGPAYGVVIKEKGFFARAVFVVDPSGKLSYVQYVPEVGSQPDFDAVLGQLKQTAKA
jgi:thioredoxin-dependent peroxiredoxin